MLTIATNNNNNNNNNDREGKENRRRFQSIEWNEIQRQIKRHQRVEQKPFRLLTSGSNNLN